MTLSLVGCDSSSEFEGCVNSDDPAAASGSREKQCPPSTFLTEDFRAREVTGVVRRGEGVVAGAFVRVDPWADLPNTHPSNVSSAVSDDVGVFTLRLAPLRYDLSVRFDDNVLVFRGLGARYFDPSIEGTSPLPGRAWTGRVDVRLERPVADGHTLAFFASGDGVFGVTGDLETGLSVLVRSYTTPAKLHVVEYETTGGLEKATAYGKTEVIVDAGVVRLATFPLAPITTFAEPRFVATAPPGLAPATVDVIIGFTRTSDARLATLPIGVSRKLPIIPDAGYTCRARGTGPDGAVSDTGETGFDVYRAETAIELPSPPVARWPLDGETRGPAEMLAVDGEGVFEHILVPQTGGPSVRLMTSDPDVALPDVRSLGAAPAIGPYTWTVRAFPTAHFVEALSGVDSRRYRPVGISAPRTIVLR
ncbi:MAG TPA: hypothetical protein VM925_04090 [Labilithrix sp.]|nr:hypothetical protein [Labilithrix sp.]